MPVPVGGGGPGRVRGSRCCIRQETASDADAEGAGPSTRLVAGVVLKPNTPVMVTMAKRKMRAKPKRRPKRFMMKVRAKVPAAAQVEEGMPRQYQSANLWGLRCG